MHRRLLALPAGAALALFAAGSVFAVWPPGNVAVESDGCTYTIHIDLKTEPDIIGWDVRVFAEEWMTGAVIATGSGVPDAKGRLTVGPFTAPAGHYNAAVDDETPVDRSSNVVDFTLSCATATPTPAATPTPTPTPTATPTATPTVTPTATPTGEELPIEATPPAGGVLGLTPPPTDSVPTVARETEAPTTALFLAVLAIVAGGVMLARRPSMARALPRSGRDVR